MRLIILAIQKVVASESMQEFMVESIFVPDTIRVKDKYFSSLAVSENQIRVKEVDLPQ